MKKLYFLLLGICLFLSGKIVAQTTVFTDDFNRATLSPGGSPSMTYASTLASNISASMVSSTYLSIGSGATAPASGISYVTGSNATLSSPFSTTLSSNPGLVTWTFNFRWNRASSNNPAAPASGAYGTAIVLAGSSATLTSGTGYAIIYGNASTPDPIRLVAYSAGVGTSTNICTSGTSDIAATNNYASVRVTYDPSTNNWSLYVRDDGASAWADPSTGVTTQKGSTTANSTYTGSALNTFGFLWSHNTGTNMSSDFDNYKVTVASGNTNYYWNGANTNSTDIGSTIWNTTDKNWSTPTSAVFASGAGAIWPSASGTYDAYFNNTQAGVKAVTLPTGTVAYAPNNTNIGTSGYSFVTAASSAATLPGTVTLGSNTLTLAAGSGGSVTLSGVVSGTGGINQNGAGTGILSAANTYNGGTTITSGTLQLGAAGVLTDAGAINLAGGDLKSGATTGFSETMGVLTLSENSTIHLGTGSHTLTFANSSGASWTSGKTLTIYGWTGTAGSSGTAGKIVVNSAGLTAAQLAQITFDGYTGAATIISGNEVVPGNTLYYWNGANTNSTDIGSTIWNTTDKNWSTPNSTVFASGAGAIWPSASGLWGAVFSNTQAGVKAVTLPGTIAYAPVNTTIGTSGYSFVTATSTAATLPGTVTLGSNTLTLAAGSSGSITLSGIVSGTGAINQNGVGTGILSAANTYSGGTTITTGTLQLGAAGVLADAGAINLAGGDLKSGATTGFTETMGVLTLSASSTIHLGTGSHTLTFANSSGASWTGATTLVIYGWTGTAGSSGTAGKIIVGAGGFTSGQLAQISFDGYAGPATIISGGELVPGSTAPTITPSVTTLTGIAYVFGSGPSSASSFTVTATNLTAGGGTITFTAPTDYEVSTTNSTTGFGTTALLTYTGTGSLTDNTVWVRLKSGLSINSYNSETITVAGGGVSSTVLVTVSGYVSSPCSPIWEENFDYGSSSSTDLVSISSGNWSTFSGSNDFNYATSGLSFTGYTSSGIGGAANFVSGSTGDIKRSFAGTAITTGYVYAAFLINMDATSSTSDDYFIGLNNSSDNYNARIFIQKGTTQYKLGISKQGTASDVQSGNLDFGTTYLVVLKYQFVAGGTNDPFSLWVISGTVPTSESAAGSATISATLSGTDATNLQYFTLRQTNKPKGYIDGIRVATTWEDAVCTATPTTYTWTGAANTTSWTTAANWSPSTGYPTSIDNVIINTAPTYLLNITDSRTIRNFTLNGTGNFNMASTGTLTITGDITYANTATATLNCGSTVNISSTASQTIPPLNYGNLNSSGGNRVLLGAATVGICNTFTRGSGTYTINTSTVNYIGTGAQTIAPGFYYNLTLSNNRSGAAITLPAYATGDIDVNNVFDVSGLSNFTVVVNDNTFNFSGTGAQTIPGFYYSDITNTGNGPRTLGTNAEININYSLTKGTGAYTVTGSTVNYSSSGGWSVPFETFTYHNLKISGTDDFVFGTGITITVNNDFTQSDGITYVNDNTGTGTLTVTNDLVLSGGALDVSWGTGIGVVTVGNDLLVSGGTLNVLYGTSATPSTTVTVTRDLTITNAGKINMEPVSSTSGVAIINVGRDFTASGTAVHSSGNGMVDFGAGVVTSNAIIIGRNFKKDGTGSFGTFSTSAARGFVLTGGTTATPATFSYSSTNSNWVQYEVATGAVVELLTDLTLSSSSNPRSSFTVNGTLDFKTYSIIAGGTTNPQFITALGTNLITSNTDGIGGTASAGSLKNFGTIGIAAAAGRAQFATGVNYTFNAATTTPFPPTGVFGAPGDITINADVTLNRAALASGTVALGTHELTLNGSDLSFSTMTGSGSVLGDNVAFITCAGTVGATPGTLRFKSGYEVIAMLTMNRTGKTLTLGSGLTIDGVNDPTNAGRLVLTEGVADFSGQTLSFINGNSPITRTNGTLTVNGSSGLVFGTTGNIGGNAFTIPAGTFTSAPAISTLAINRTNALTLNTQGMELTGSLTLTAGTLKIASSLLNLNNATLSAPGGYLEGSTTSDLTIKGTHADTVVIPLPTATNISLKTVNIEGTRKVAMATTPVNDVQLYGTMTIASGATYSNGGESRIFNSNPGVTAIDIYGKFITLDQQGFYGTNTSITSTLPTLRDGSTVEYGLYGNQVVTSTSALSSQQYYHIIFSGNGTKTPANAVQVNTNGSVTITGTSALIVDATNYNIGLTSANATAFNMDGGILKLGTTGTLPLMDGTYNLTGGVVWYNAGASSQSIRAKTYHGIEVYGTNVGNSAAITLNSNGGSFTIKNGGNYFMNTNSIQSTSGTNTTTVVVENGATFRTGNSAGFSGTNPGDNTSIHSNISVSNITLAAGSTVEYYRSTPTSVSGDQTITNRLDYQHLTLSGNGIKTAPSGTLTVKGNLVKSGTSTFAHNDGLVLLNGADQNFAGLPYNSLTLTNTSGSTKTLVGDGSLADALTLGGTSTTLAIGDNELTLRSSATKTARVAQVPTSASITYGTGNFKIERYLPMDISGSSFSRRWRLMGVPISSVSAPTIKSAWQEGGLGLSSTGAYTIGPDAYDPNPGYGTRITNGTTAANGFDAGTTSNPSIYYWDGTKWTVPSATTNTITNVNAYMLFVRGDRSVPVTNQYQATSGGANTRIKGRINVGAVNVPVSTGNNFLSNPYPSAINMEDVGYGSGGVVSTPITTYYLWDPKLLGSNNVGGWATFSWNSGSGKFDYVPYTAYPGGSTGMSNFAATTGTIESGMAFMINKSGAIPSTNFVFNETDKIASIVGNTTTGIASRPVASAPSSAYAQFYTNLYYITGGGTEILADGVATTYWDNFNNEVTDEDAVKIQTFSTKEKIALLRDDSLLAIERRKTITVNDTIYLQMIKLNSNTRYQLQFVGKNFAPDLTAFLIDKYLNKFYIIPTEGITKHSFETNSTAASIDVNRFKVVFREPEGGSLPVPVTFTLINAIKNTDGVIVDWKVENEINIVRYEVERSADGINFTKVNTTNATGNTSNNYSWTDADPTPGDNFYRIKSIGKDGSLLFSKIVKINYGDVSTDFTIYPNPTLDGKIGVNLYNVEKGQYTIRLMNNLGQLLQSKYINHAGGNSLISLQPLTIKGVYHVEIIKPDLSKQTIKVIY